jgi:putative hemolysin
LRKPFFVPETKPVDDLLQEFLRSHNHIAVVLDEYGGVSGIVTIEDVLEEIVGEIADEHDEALIDGIKTLDEHSAEALANVRIHEINERLGLSLPENENYDTIGGFVFHELGRIPNVGEELTWHGVRIKVLDATRRRIGRVRIQVLSQPQPAA